MVKTISTSAIRDLLELTEQPHVISLAGGLPNPATFPVAAIAEATANVLAADPGQALQYGPTEGHRPLRAWVADQLDAAVEQVTITSGSQQAIDLVTRVLVDPGDAVVLADPGYVGALQTFRTHGARLVGIGSDRHGLRVDDLAELLHDGLRPALVYVVSSFDNPTGATLSARRRIALAELAEAHGFWIVDDDPYGELRWSGTSPTALRRLTSRTITLGSTSKVLCPGLRVGWAMAPASITKAIVAHKQAADLHTSALSQSVAHRLLGDPAFLATHLDLLRTTYRAQAGALVAALTTHLGDRIELTAPHGGMFLWARILDPSDNPVDADRLLPRALDSGTAFVPGSAFSVQATLPGTVRLSFATAGIDDLDEAARRLAEACERGGAG
jgi:2-aminoadipate transaminase